MKATKIGPEGAKLIGKALSRNRTLKTLDVSSEYHWETTNNYLTMRINNWIDNDIRSSGMEHISKGLKSDESLTELSIYGKLIFCVCFNSI